MKQYIIARVMFLYLCIEPKVTAYIVWRMLHERNIAESVLHR